MPFAVEQNIAPRPLYVSSLRAQTVVLHPKCFPYASQQRRGSADILSIEAERNGIAVIRVPEEQLLLFIGAAREGFKEHMGKNRVQ